MRTAQVTRQTWGRIGDGLLVAASAAVLALAVTEAPANAAIDGGHDGQVFIAIAHDGGTLHDATVSTDNHFPVDRLGIDGPGLRDVPDHNGRDGIWRFDLVGHSVDHGQRVCGYAILRGRMLGHPCVNF